MFVAMASKPLQEPAFLVLSALAAGPLHGYGIAQDVESSSDGRVTLRAGTLYGAIDRLVAAGLVEVDHEEVVDSRLRRYYRLTTEGGSRLAAEAERAEAQARRALERLGARRRASAVVRDGAAARPARGVAGGLADGGAVPA
jgi:DNA-binding PadR family transcriptional regulator